MIRCDFCKDEAIGRIIINDIPTINVCLAHAEKNKLLGRLHPFNTSVLELKVACSHCFEQKPLSDYYYYNDARGVRRRRTECRECNLMERKIRRLKKK